MASPTWKQLRDAGAFETLGELFPDVLSGHAFLEDLGISPALLPPFGGPLPAASWWRTVCRTVDQGRFAGITLGDLVTAAAARFPGHEGLAALAGQGAPAGLRVLCLMAAPLDEARLRLGAEQRVVQDAAARSAGRLTVTVHPAVRVADLLPGLRTARPHLVHFAGHGTDDGRLLLEDDTGTSAPVPVRALAAALALAAPLVCVVLNSCWSGAYADGLLDCADTVVGTRGTLDDAAALVFAEGFYGALAHCTAVDRACDAARAALALAGHAPDEVRQCSRGSRAA
ncbi:CHAT domain-containing protein [Streptomyces sp. MUSC 14]|uniref:CHAT domain-containing protein n=1 Tax=Streptomyces sp. MUSC 14 TaxID=1354889 RepID=UPI0009A0A9B1|nr:effector-associated domain EAD1-containing protein [Streptomyces sp. MUSC 14]